MEEQDIGQCFNCAELSTRLAESEKAREKAEEALRIERWPDGTTIEAERKRAEAVESALAVSEKARAEAEEKADRQYLEAAELLHDKSAQLAALQEENVRIMGIFQKIAAEVQVPDDTSDINEYESVLGFVAEYVQEALSTTPETAKVRRRLDDGQLAECPLCGSLDIGGSQNTVHCYGCGLSITKPKPLENAVDAWNRRKGVPLNE